MMMVDCKRHRAGFRIRKSTALYKAFSDHDDLHVDHPALISVPTPDMPLPLSSSTVKVLLQYLTELDGSPLPPHFISLPLLQRHHFLHLAPEDSVAYLTWPSSSSSLSSEDGAKAVGMLSSIQHDDEPDNYTIGYAGDEENMYAHVQIPIGLRMVLHWDEAESVWKYHNLALMPFPDGLHDSVESTAASNLHPTDGDGDDYWDSYGQDGEDEGGRGPTKETQWDSNANTEDAYWNQYSSVHGRHLTF